MNPIPSWSLRGTGHHPALSAQRTGRSGLGRAEVDSCDCSQLHDGHDLSLWPYDPTRSYWIKNRKPCDTAPSDGHFFMGKWWSSVVIRWKSSHVLPIFSETQWRPGWLQLFGVFGVLLRVLRGSLRGTDPTVWDRETQRKTRKIHGNFW